MLFDRFADLCKQSGVTPNKALVDCEISRTSVAKWKKGAIPNGKTLSKIADYFSVSVGYLLGEETDKAPDESGKRSISDEDIKAAFFNGADPSITKEEMDAMWDDAKAFIQFKMEQRKRSKNE